MSETFLIKKKKNEIIKKKINKKKQPLKQIEYSFQLTKEINTRNVFQIAGDITINIDSLLNQDYLFSNFNVNEFLQVKQVKMQHDLQVIDIQMDTDIQVRNDMSIPIQFIRRSQRQDLSHLAEAIEQFQKVQNEKRKLNSNLLSSQQIQQNTCQPESLTEICCNEDNGWNFEKSLEKAEKVINDLKEKMKSSDMHYSFVLSKGNKYDQSVYRVGNSTKILKDFFCLNNDQIAYISNRKPTLFFFKHQHQLITYLIGRIKTQIMFLMNDKNVLDSFRSEPKLLSENTIAISSVDNLVVEVQIQTYLYILSNYQNQVDDILWLTIQKPIRDQSPQEVLKGLRNLKKYLNEQQESSKLNPFYNGQLYSDIIYEAQSELFRDKFYSLVDSNLYHQVLESL
ncbi:hypothetical protein TTHERM_00753390 (macronuclear) [Tetrahymena thermophila SB210]|uniref:Uncharacterized protein n=1 Tax=Tetrahymena thermophila (strain SB210) TaxID=312017 RepID=Q23NI1_TETTS|nr:hypothetical protein TTHERM_00753390 [Tetrahymena thermophila SB210]EAR98093.1 hypothetical protein TTHERM_00753390 [Tetrahymena thermophila SB210]|eukprot:XP_001018338.1 hypothetical protein TTHERM_00753390 [Tetrahymena thermophila SB210]